MTEQRPEIAASDSVPDDTARDAPAALGRPDARAGASSPGREALGRIVHAKRLACEAERAKAEGRKRFSMPPWEERPRWQQELDMAIGEAVAAAVREADGAKLAETRRQACEWTTTDDGSAASATEAVCGWTILAIIGTEPEPPRRTAAELARLDRMVTEHGNAVAAVRKALDMAAALGDANRKVIAAARDGLKVLEGAEEGTRS